MSIKDEIESYLLKTDKWVSTRELRNMFGEAADRRLRELREDGLKIKSMRGKDRIDGRVSQTFFWKAIK